MRVLEHFPIVGLLFRRGFIIDHFLIRNNVLLLGRWHGEGASTFLGLLESDAHH